MVFKHTNKLSLVTAEEQEKYYSFRMSLNALKKHYQLVKCFLVTGFEKGIRNCGLFAIAFLTPLSLGEDHTKVYIINKK